jgi:hypothetical protein
LTVGRARRKKAEPGHAARRLCWERNILPDPSSSLADCLRDWRDFYLLIGDASATLVGLMFAMPGA